MTLEDKIKEISEACNEYIGAVDAERSLKYQINVNPTPRVCNALIVANTNKTKLLETLESVMKEYLEQSDDLKKLEYN